MTSRKICSRRKRPRKSWRKRKPPRLAGRMKSVRAVAGAVAGGADAAAGTARAVKLQP
jgi:hypothetical protein